MDLPPVEVSTDRQSMGEAFYNGSTPPNTEISTDKQWMYEAFYPNRGLLWQAVKRRSTMDLPVVEVSTDRQSMHTLCEAFYNGSTPSRGLHWQAVNGSGVLQWIYPQ